MTPSGLEKGQNVTLARSGTGVSTEGGERERAEVIGNCNECDEALAGAREVIGAARRLAMVAMSAVMNGDPHRTREVLEQLGSVLASQNDRTPTESQSERRLR